MHRRIGPVVFVLFLVAWLGAADTPTKPVAATIISQRGQTTVRKAIEALQATGNRVFLDSDVSDSKAQFSIDGLTFWQAADTIADSAKLQVLPGFDPQTKEPAVGFVSPSGVGSLATPKSIAYDGPFRVRIQRLNAVRNLEDDSLSNLTVTLQLAWEPRYQPLMLKMAADSIKAVGANGKAETAEQGGTSALRLLGEPAVEIPVRLPLPPRSAPTLRKLEGQCTVLVPPTKVPFAFAKPAQGVQQENQGVKIAIHRWEAQAKAALWTVGLTLTYPAGKMDLESHQTWALDGNEILLVHRNGGRVLPSTHREVSIEDGGAMRVTYYFDRPAGEPADYRMEYRALAVPEVYPLKFAFAELPLP